MPPTDKPVELSEVERLLTALGQNASGWAGPVRLLWRYAKALVAEVAALRTENETLTAHIAVLDDDADAALDVRDEAIEAESQAGDRIAAELAAERARHETTRTALAAIAEACIVTINNASYIADMPLPDAIALARIQAAFASSLLRLATSACQHCGHVGPDGEDHTCPCPNPDGGCRCTLSPRLRLR